MRLVAQYRQFAQECRRLAADRKQSAEKQMLESMARAWDRVADERASQLRQQIDICNGVNIPFERELNLSA
jgi:excinuclease UvrABC nuclease subunit